MKDQSAKPSLICEIHNRQLDSNGNCADCHGKPKQIERKLIKVSWVAPNGKPYSDSINMSLDEYTNFVNNLLELKKRNIQ